MNHKILLPTTLISSLALLASVSHAQTTVSFTDLNSDITASNTVLGSGSGATSSTGVDNGTTFTYSVTYGGFDFDGDTIADSFSFDVTVAGVSDSTDVVNSGLGTSTATIGSTAGDVTIATGTTSAGGVWIVSGSRFAIGETLIWTVDNIQTTNSAAGLGLNVNFDGFLGGLVADYNFNGSPSAVLGSGIGLNGYSDLNSFNGLIAAGAQETLYISSSLEAGGSANFGVDSVDFDFTVSAVAIPEPSAYALLAGVAGFALVVSRRRKA